MWKSPLTAGLFLQKFGITDFEKRLKTHGQKIRQEIFWYNILHPIKLFEKADKPVEFGMKLDISGTGGWTRLEYRSFDAYNEATKLQEMIENFHRCEGHYPGRVLADKIYRNRENLSYCKERGIRLSGPALGRPKKGEERNKVQDYQDECERIEVERKFSLGKRKCGMDLVTAKLEDTAAHVVALSILPLNLRKIQYAFLQFWD